MIKADNVTIEPPKPRRRAYDPFFGGPIKDDVEEEKVEEKYEEVEAIDKDVEDDDDDYKDDDDKKRPFSWV